MALTLALMTIGNAFLDGSDRGLRRSYVESFTGDLAIREASKESFSVFGSQTPIVGSLTRMPAIASFEEVGEIAQAAKGVEAVAPIVCGVAVLRCGAYSKPVSVFGVEGASYFVLFPGLKVKEGRALSGSTAGLMLTAARAAEIGAATGKALSIGDPVALEYFNSGHFQLRELPVAGILEYPVDNETLGSIVLADAPTLRSLLGLGARPEGRDDETKGLSTASVDGLFKGAKDIEADPSAGLRLSDVEALLRSGSGSGAADSADSAVWDYLLVRLKDGSSPSRAAASLSAVFASKELPVVVQDWREAAGSSALYVYWLRLIFNIGVFVALFAGGIIIVNALTIAVFERTGEIGTMRALGAPSGLVRRLFIAETMLLVLGSALAGIGMGALACAVLGARGMTISNATAVTLFGSTRLRPFVAPSSAALQLAVAAFVGAVAWIYPVRVALRIQPARAIGAE